MRKQGKRIMIMAVIVVALVGAACGKPNEASSAMSSEPFKTADELIAEAEMRDQAISAQAAQEKAVEFSEVAGRYICSLPEVDEAFFPALELDEQGKAVFHANIFAGMGEIKGSYTFSDANIQIKVENIDFNGFAGEKVTEMYFKLLPDGGLELSYVNPDTPVGVTNSGDKFSKKID